jgi:beta-galactosidase
MNRNSTKRREISRREFVQTCALGTAALASVSPLVGHGIIKVAQSAKMGPASGVLSLDRNWRFGGLFNGDAASPKSNDAAFSDVVLPHCVSKLSWQKWDPAAWENVWIYRQHFSLPREFSGQRVFLRFDGVMVGATPVINGHPLPQHVGGYLPFGYEITEWLAEGESVLAVSIDSRWQDVPPEGSPKGPSSIDYLEPGGIPRSVTLHAFPAVFISDVFAKPVDVLDGSRRIEVTCRIDAAAVPSKPARIKVELMDGTRRIAGASQTLSLEQTGETPATLTLSGLGNIKLWDVSNPHLYDVVTTLIVDQAPVHESRIRIGLRDARFEIDGFFLNGSRLQLFGLNRHELYPYVGSAMPPRVQRHDAEILRREFNCNFVRCSHYPQSEAFLDACDELGLMVWEEVPGWGYLGDQTWQDLLVRDVNDMISRDRNHPSIVIWGVRANESPNNPALYQRTMAVAKSLDDSRPTSGTMTSASAKNWVQEWHQDVFAFDDYHSDSDGSVGIREPLPGVPYLVSEAVGQFAYGAAGGGFGRFYRRAGDPLTQMQQAVSHAQAHSKAASYPRCAGVIAWCAFDYGSLINSYNGVKTPGVADVFRIPKLGASFYQTQGNPKLRPLIKPNFYWDFGPQTPLGPGKHAAIFSNCDHLELFVNGDKFAVAQPDRENFPHLHYPPFFCDFVIEGTASPELRIDGYIGGRLTLSSSFSSDTTQDQLFLAADDAKLNGDGADATRLVFAVVDKFGAPRPFAGGEVAFELTGPGLIVGDNPFPLADSGGVGAIWIRTVVNSSGQIGVTAKHSFLGSRSVEIDVEANASDLEKSS